ncbi:uncharacterized protein si:ch211-130h14.4 isoform X1 [Salvelinus fontinalis]|uniref:uncharacterized protein si:ch211-130h14.4 isoform X1 n=1 Tax=Salvelinus fontinalis TaxID=8038 RepID=UPI00248656EF|nr:uncharacterized protein si:ch211-130h14.4 isoform X1 [Salvelinus fontinalis]XP_055721810.1 uncharacterized protein si:ch211-130h14.4 isoform X1 [Salvelinus fontinalis]XP_055721894.1 uncharacterized protein si:ch211-130h14.4 isoform X1 [Salvelinus fontinalis]
MKSKCKDIHQSSNLPCILETYLPSSGGKKAENEDRPQRWRKKLTQSRDTGTGGQDHPGSAASDPDSVIRQALLDQRHLEAYRNMHRLRDILYRRYSAMLRDKIHTQRQEIQRRAEAAGAVTEDKHIPKLRKLTCSTLSHDNTYLRSLPQTSYYLILGLQNQLSRHGCLKTLQDQEDFCFTVNHHNRGPVQLQRTLQEIRKRMIGSRSTPDVMSAGWGWSQQEMLVKLPRIHVTTAERRHLDRIVPSETGRRLMPGERLPERGSRERLPQRGSGEKLPERGSGERLPERGSGERLPERGSGEKLPERGSGERLPERGSGERLPERGSGERLPERGSGEKLPERGSGEKLPERGSGENSAACLFSQQQEQDYTEQMFPKVKVPKFATLQPSFLKNLKTVMPAVGVEEIPEKSKRAEMTVRMLRHMHSQSLTNMAVSQRLLQDINRHSLGCCWDHKRSFHDLTQYVFPSVHSNEEKKKRCAGNLPPFLPLPPPPPLSYQEWDRINPDDSEVPSLGLEGLGLRTTPSAGNTEICSKTPEPLSIEDVCQRNPSGVIDCGYKLWRNYDEETAY